MSSPISLGDGMKKVVQEQGHNPILNKQFVGFLKDYGYRSESDSIEQCLRVFFSEDVAINILNNADTESIIEQFKRDHKELKKSDINKVYQCFLAAIGRKRQATKKLQSVKKPTGANNNKQTNTNKTQNNDWFWGLLGLLMIIALAFIAIEFLFKHALATIITAIVCYIIYKVFLS